MGLNGSGVRDTARFLSVGVSTIDPDIEKKRSIYVKVNWEKLKNTDHAEQKVLLLPVILELDEQWSFVGNKSNQRWLWLAVNHYNSEVLTYSFGDRTDEACHRLKQLLRPFSITKYFTDGLGDYYLMSCMKKGSAIPKK